MSNLGKRSAKVTDELDLSGRVKILEHGIHKLETSFEARFLSLEKAITRLTENIQGRPVTPPFKEIIISVGATLGVLMTVATVIGGYVDRTVALNAAELKGADKVIEYRLQSLEKLREKHTGLVMLPNVQGR